MGSSSGPWTSKHTRRTRNDREDEMRVRQALVASAAIFGAIVAGGIVQGAEIGPGLPWRGAGAQPCFGIDGGTLKCPEAARTIAVRAGQLFDSNDGQDADQSGHPDRRRAHHAGRSCGASADSGRRDRSSICQHADRAARPDRRAHAYVQHAQARHVARDVDPDRDPEHAGRFARRLHRACAT